MSKQLTLDDARQSLTAHLAARGAEVREKYGPHLCWDQLRTLLDDRYFVRYPVEVCFDATPLQSGEFAYPVPKGPTPEEGFRLCIHPAFCCQLDRVPWLVLYQLVLVNYGEFASADDAETFGSQALGIDKEDYYQGLCALADQLASSGPAT